MASTKKILDSFHRGDTKEYKFVFDDGASTPAPIDITNWTLWFTLKSNLSSVDGASELQFQTTAGDNTKDDPINGLMFLEVSSVNTQKVKPGKYYYDFQRVIEGTNPLEVSTLFHGNVTVLEDVTRSVAIDTIPDDFDFLAVGSVNQSMTVVSNIITVTGINFASPITISGDGSSEYSINGKDYTSAPGTVSYGDKISVRHTSASSPATQVDSVLTIGTVSSTFSSTTV